MLTCYVRPPQQVGFEVRLVSSKIEFLSEPIERRHETPIVECFSALQLSPS